MSDFDARQAGIDLMGRLMEIKQPLDDERTRKQQELGAMKAEFKQKVEGARGEIIALHQKIAPIDELIRNAAALKKAKGDTARRMAETIVEEIGRLINGSGN